MPETIAILTARGGSKRIPRKNIRTFGGKPMIAWPIEAALASGCFAHVLVSTDSAEISDIAKTYGAEVPFLRPAHLADDFTHAHKAARHMLEWALDAWGEISFFAHIYPTAVFLKSEDICQGLALLRQGKQYVYTAQKLAFPIYQTTIINDAGDIVPLFPYELRSLRSQDMPQAYIDAGQLYWFNTKVFLDQETSISQGVAVIEISPERAIDIDTEEDWQQLIKIHGQGAPR